MKVSIVIPNRNDTVMLAVTVRSALEAIKGVEGGGEVIVADNSDRDMWEILKTPNVSPLPLMCLNDGSLVIVRQEKPGLYAARQNGTNVAKGEYIVNTDSHVVIGHNTIRDLVRFMDDDKEGKVGFAFAPICWISQHETYGRHDIRIDKGIYGNWGRQYSKPQKICWNFGWRICRTKWFNEDLGGYGFYAKSHVSWGGGEMYTPMKAWLLGYENWAVPTDPFYHIGPFSKEVEQRTGYRYRLYGSSGNGKLGLGVVAAFYALGGDEMKAECMKADEVLRTNFGIVTKNVWEQAKEIANDDWLKLKAKQKITYFELMEKQPWNDGDYGHWDDWNAEVGQGIDVGKIIHV